MHLKTNDRKRYFALVCLVLLLAGCSKSAQEAQPQPSPVATATPSSQPAEDAGDGLSAVAVRILNKAQRGGGAILRGQCGAQGPAEQYKLSPSATLEPMDKALQEISAKYQNIYWRESPASGVRIADATAKAGLLRVRVREFRVVEDREADRVMAVLWRTPEVQAFLRHNHMHFARRADGERRVLTTPIIVEVKNGTVAEVLDRIAAGYRQSPPKVWIYQECAEKKETMIDVQMR